MICAPRCVQSTPKVRAIPATCPSLSWAASNSMAIMCSHPRQLWLLHQEQGVEHDCFRERNRQNGLHQYLCGCAGIASHRGRGGHADETYADGCAERGQADGHISAKKAPSHCTS